MSSDMHLARMKGHVSFGIDTGMQSQSVFLLLLCICDRSILKQGAKVKKKGEDEEHLPHVSYAGYDGKQLFSRSRHAESITRSTQLINRAAVSDAGKCYFVFHV